jgi:DNA-binding NtrC family response regulator
MNLFKEVIEESGYDTMGFTNPIMAIDYMNIHHAKFGLFIIDYEMPQMKGCELANKIAQIDTSIKMVLVTAINDVVNNTLNLELIYKPIRISQLLQIVRRYMSVTT